ncbi:Hypothetical predicted protein [Octopus vulgaris]|uniref:Uncharacterized protein n=1 Tax=Octopus vulgaris TaxID=6645 RepID=A0AA36BM38_OCTVU|nr:Hypothetical predicted protein [Octopus vulgaris]
MKQMLQKRLFVTDDNKFKYSPYWLQLVNFCLYAWKYENQYRYQDIKLQNQCQNDNIKLFSEIHHKILFAHDFLNYENAFNFHFTVILLLAAKYYDYVGHTVINSYLQ